MSNSKNIQKITYNNRSYIWDGNKDDFSTFRIENEQPINVPTHVTKYFRISKYSVDALLNNYIYAAHPKELNDPFDCYSKLIDTSEVSNKDVDFVEKKLRIKINREFILNKKNKNNFIEILYELIFGSCGIISVTDAKNQNPSLWANYTNNHQGFSVTYKKEAFRDIAIGPFKVDYVDNLERLKYKSESFNSLVLWLTLIKSKYWRNEEEWRFIGRGMDTMYIPNKHFNKEKELTKNNRKLYLLKESVLEVRLGFYFFSYDNIITNNLNESVVNLNNEKDKELKIKLLRYIKSNEIPLSYMHLDENEFKFRSVKLNYDFIEETYTIKWKLPTI